MENDPAADPHFMSVPIINDKCPEKGCHAPFGICKIGSENWEKCPQWLGSPSKASGKTSKAAEATAPALVETPPAWSGCALGTDDLDMIAARTPPHLVTILGPHNAGKTTLLAAWYRLLLRGTRLPGRRFAGSASLEGWESIAHWLRWDQNIGPTFPPHTTMGQGRRPGVLHLALRREGDGRLEDLLLTDAPGEWFARWAMRRDDPGAEGARWAVRHADAFLFVIDSESLTGPGRGGPRNRIVQLARRLRDDVGTRPVHLVWTKADITVGHDFRANLEGDLAVHLPGAQVWELSVQPRQGHDTGSDLIAVLAASLPSESLVDRPVLQLAPPPDTTDPLLLYRGA